MTNKREHFLFLSVAVAYCIDKYTFFQILPFFYPLLYQVKFYKNVFKCYYIQKICFFFSQININIYI